jgi:hypothetical protein
MTMWHTFPLRILKSSWGIAIDLRARAVLAAKPKAGAMRVAERVQLDVSKVQLPDEDNEQLIRGLKIMAAKIMAAQPHGYVVIEVDKVEYTPTDYQPEGLAAAMIGWAAEEFNLTQPDMDVYFDKAKNRYVFSIA